LMIIKKELKRKYQKISFKGKIVMITGATSGIGEYLVTKFLELEANKIVVTGRNLKQL